MIDDNTTGAENSSLNEDVLNDSLDAYTQTEGASDKPKNFGSAEPEVVKQSIGPEKKSKKKLFIVLASFVVVAFAMIVVIGESRKGEAPPQDEYTASADDFLETIEPSQYDDSTFSDDNADVFIEESVAVIPAVRSEALMEVVKANALDATPAIQIKPIEQGSQKNTVNVDTKIPPLTEIKANTQQQTLSSDGLAAVGVLINDALTTMSKMQVEEQTADTAYRSEQDIKMTVLANEITLLRSEIKSLLLVVKSKESDISKSQSAQIQPTEIQATKRASYVAPNLTWVTFVEGRGVAIVDGTTRELGLEVNEQLKGRGTIKSISSKGCITFFEAAKEYAPTNGSCDFLRD
jgi:hypothetical protein